MAISRDYVDAMVCSVRRSLDPERPHLALAEMSGWLRCEHASLARLLRDICDLVSDALLPMSSSDREVLRLRHELREAREVVGRLMDVVHEEALQRNRWYDCMAAEEEERLRDVTAALASG